MIRECANRRENLQEQTSAEQQATNAYLLHDRDECSDRGGVAAATHPTHTPTKNGDIVSLESFIHDIPDQAGPNHGSGRCRIVRHLGELFRVNQDSLG